jgi:hypothetical protein
MAPSAAEIYALFNSFLGGSGMASAVISQLQVMREKASPDIKFQIVGQEFALACQVQGIDALAEHVTTRLVPSFMAASDMTKPGKSEVIRVIGGGTDPWAAAEFKSTGTSKAGKSLYELRDSETLI